MAIALLINLLWILWTTYVLATGFGTLEGKHPHVYLLFFVLGLTAMLVGSVWLKVLHFRNRITLSASQDAYI